MVFHDGLDIMVIMILVTSRDIAKSGASAVVRLGVGDEEDS